MPPAPKGACHKIPSPGLWQQKHKITILEEWKKEKEKSNIVTMPNISRFLISIREPITFDDGTQVLDDVLKGKVVVLNLEMLEVDKKRQIFDFVSGGIYSLSGKIQKVTKDIFILAPKGIDIDGKVKDQIENNGFYQI